MKKRFFFIILFLLILLAYVTNLSQIPQNIILLNGEKLELKTLLGIQLTSQSQETQETWQGQDIKTKKVSVNLFNKFKIKEISVIMLPEVKVIPCGNLIGLKLYTNGVLVIGMAELTNTNNQIEKPYETTQLQEGDTIIELNNNEIDSIKTLQEVVNKSKGDNIKIKYTHDGEILTSNIKPLKVDNDEYRLGLWVRDSASGVGTISFYEPNTNRFAALGHGISDLDTDELLNIETGEMVTSKIIHIEKGKSGHPGEIKGSISNGYEIGKVDLNTNFGIFGEITNAQNSNPIKKYSNGIEIARRDEIKTGNATMLCTLKDNIIEEFEIEIEQIYLDNDINNKSMLINIKDDELIKKTGGIICGMSGSPIIQNNKLIGVLTNVLVSNPEKGYAVFSDIMLKKMMQ